MSTFCDRLSAELARAEAHLLHCKTILGAIRGGERALITAGIPAIEADEIIRNPSLVPSARHVASTKQAIAKLKRRIDGLDKFAAARVSP